MKRQFQRNYEAEDSLLHNQTDLNVQQSQKQQNDSKIISNRQKILNLHERIKMLDQNNFQNPSRNIGFDLGFQTKKKTTENRNQQNDGGNFTMGGQQQTFIQRSVSPKRAEFSNSRQKQNDMKFTTENIYSQSNQNNLSRGTLLNHSLNSQTSALRLPYTSPKHNQNYESQNHAFSNNSNAYVRPSLNPLTQFFPLESKYLSIEQKFLKFKLSEQNLIKNIESQIHDLQQNCKFLKKDLEKCQKRNEEHLQSTQKNLNCQIQELYEELKQLKKGAIQSIDTKYKAIKTQTIVMIGEQFQNQCKSSSHELHSHIEGVNKLIQKEQNLRDQTAQFLINSFGDQIIKLQEVLNHQRQARIQKNDELLRLINQVQDQLFDKINKQKRQMNQNNQAMENMLQEVCYKIEEKILGC